MPFNPVLIACVRHVIDTDELNHSAEGRGAEAISVSESISPDRPTGNVMLMQTHQRRTHLHNYLGLMPPHPTPTLSISTRGLSTGGIFIIASGSVTVTNSSMLVR